VGEPPTAVPFRLATFGFENASLSNGDLKGGQKITETPISS
jgi:hypothetical protein